MNIRHLSILLVGAWLGGAMPCFAQDSLCAVVKIEILQELTLERQAFDARMKITNDTALPLNDVDIVVNFADADGEPVSASADPNNTTAQFFIRIDSLDGITDVAGNGTVPGGAAAEIHWLIIPAPGAAGAVPNGTLYYVGATLRYTLGGEEQETEVAPDQIMVKPMPLLTLDYFLPDQVYGDDPFTTMIEPEVPFSLGVRVSNNGHGPANNLKIESGQPTIVENDLGLLINFRIHGSRVGNLAAGDSLLVEFGTIAPSRSGTARWIMTASLSGRFVAFDATFSHADELGGQLTSLMEAVNTHFLVADVRADLPGRDDVDDFLARTGDTLKLFESDGIDTPVADVSAQTSLTTTRASIQEMSLTLPATPVAFVYAKKPDPARGTLVPAGAVRDDGKRLPAANVWLSKTWDNPARRWDHFVSIFDFHPPTAGGGRADGAYSYTLMFDPESRENRAPVLGYTGPRYVQAGHHLGFIVIASDPDGTVPSLSADGLPDGATFTDLGTGTGEFSWFTNANQTGVYQVVLTASDGELSRSEAVTITVSGDPVYSTVAGRIWNDLNFNGIQDDGEPGLAGIAVRLLDVAGTELKVTMSTANGTYEFAEVVPGQVVVDVVAPDDWRFSPAKTGADHAVDSDVLSDDGRTGVIVVGPAMIVQVDAGLAAASSLRTLRTLVSGCGHVDVLAPAHRASADGFLFLAGSAVELEAGPATACRFNAWYEETAPDGPAVPLPDATTATLSLTLDTDRTVVADFLPAAPPPTVLAVHPEPDTMVPGYAELRVTIAEAPTALRPVPAAVPFAQPGGPTHDLLVGETPVSIGEFLDFLNDALARTPDTREAPVFINAATGRAYFNSDQTAATLLFDPAPNGLPEHNDWSITFIPGADGLPDNYNCTPESRDCPVVGVTWYGSVKYANWLTRRKGLGWVHWAYREGLEGADWRPAHLTAAEWPHNFDDAARAAWIKRYPDAFRLLMDGGQVDAAAFNEWYKAAAWNPEIQANQDSGTVPNMITLICNTGERGPPINTTAHTNAFGLKNMLGTVRTWVTDAGNSDGERAIRGCSWLDDPETCDASTRRDAAAAAAFDDVGLRVVTSRDYIVSMQTATDAEFALRIDRDADVARAWQPNPGLLPNTEYWWRFRVDYPTSLLPSSPAEVWTGTAIETPSVAAAALHFSTTTITRFGLNLRPGWNLISTPLIPEIVELSCHLMPLFTIWSWDGSGQHYEQLSCFHPGMGAWVYAPDSGQLVVTGPLPESGDVVLVPGWNLIGLKQLSPLLNVDMNSLAVIFSWQASNSAQPGSYFLESNQTPIVLHPGLGYWIWSSAPTAAQILRPAD